MEDLVRVIFQKLNLFVIGLFSSIAFICSSLFLGFSANADEYPNKPIEIVIHAKYGVELIQPQNGINKV